MEIACLKLEGNETSSELAKDGTYGATPKVKIPASILSPWLTELGPITKMK